MVKALQVKLFQMKKIAFIIYFLAISLFASAQQEYSMHFMRDVWNSNYTNPGLQPYQKFFITGTSVGASLSFKGLNDTPLFVEDADGKFTPNYQNLIDNLDEDVRIRANLSAELFGVGFKMKKLFFSLSTATKANAQVVLPKDIFEVAWYGNEPFVGQTIEIGPGISVEAYQEIALGVNYTFNRNLSAGIRAKRLTGIFSASTIADELSLTTGENHYETTIATNYIANISSSFLNIVAPSDGLILNTTASFNQAAVDDIVDNRQLPEGNSGWAGDFGVSFNLKDKVELSLSALDIGYIDWTTGVSGLQSNGTFYFDGLTLEQATSGNTVSFISVEDSLVNLLKIAAVPGSTFRTNLSPKFYASALFRYGYWELGGMWYNELAPNDEIISSIGFSGRYVLDDKLSFGAVYAYHDGRFDNLGVNTSLKLGPLQIHLLVDNIFPLFKPETIRYTNIRAGANIVFGTKKMREFRKGRLDEPTLPSENEDKKKKKKDKESNPETN
jgi:hypothetical protein